MIYLGFSLQAIGKVMLYSAYAFWDKKIRDGKNV